MELVKGLTRRKETLLERLTELRENPGLVQGILVSLGLAAITGVAAQVRLPIPFSPVPMTGQVFVVLLIGSLFGKKLGAGSQAFYVGLGSMGLPWFSGLSGGFAALAGPTGGYILGFLPAAYLLGWLSEHFDLNGFTEIFSAGLVGLGVIYFFGSLQLSLFLNSGPMETITVGLVPFVWLDLFKLLLVALVIRELNPGTR